MQKKEQRDTLCWEEEEFECCCGDGAFEERGIHGGGDRSHIGRYGVQYGEAQEATVRHNFIVARGNTAKTAHNRGRSPTAEKEDITTGIILENARETGSYIEISGCLLTSHRVI